MKKLLTTLLISGICMGVYAQDGLPTNPEPGKCYAKCISPDEYKAENQRVMTKPAYKTLKVVPAEYKTEVETVVIKPETEKYTFKPATYRTVTDTIWTKQGYDKLAVLPSQFSDDSENVEIKSKSGKWVAGVKDPDCPSIDPADCRVLHYRAFPAVNKGIPVKKLVKDESTSAKPIKGKYILVKRQVEVTKAKYDVTKIPAQKREVSKQVRVKNETTTSTTVPAVYLDVEKKILVKAGGLTVWREVPCTIAKQGEVLPIKYEVGSAKLTARSLVLIDNKLLKFMRDQPTAIVEIGSHTDARGSAPNNMSLSERRAKSVVEYLISKGISKDRLMAVGYGETKLVNECSDGVSCTSTQHAVNRRTEFKVF